MSHFKTRLFTALVVVAAMASAAQAAPDLTAWALMLTGFGGMGAMLRRNRRQPALARI